MNQAPLHKTSAERPAPLTEHEVYVRDHNGGVKRVPISVADALVAKNLAHRVSRAGHVRLVSGLRLDRIDLPRGAGASQTTLGRQATKEHHPRCREWRQPA
jgi:hypothetical protein